MAHRASHGTSIPSDEFLSDGLDAAGVEWRTIPSWPDYQASDSGEVRRSRLGRSNACKLGKHLTRNLSVLGYLRVGIMRDGKMRTIGVHRLVAEAFHGPAPTAEHHAAHGDGVRTDNRPRNLRWATPAENQADSIRHGTKARGERTGKGKFTSDDILTIRGRYPATSQEKLAREFATTQSHIGRIVRRQVWAHLL